MATPITIQNHAYTYLKKPVVVSDASLTVHEVRRFPDAPFYLKVGREMMLVTGKADVDILSVTRGQLGTTATVHAEGDLVIQTLIQENYDQYLNDRVLFAKSRPQIAKISDASGAEMKVADMTWINQGSATATDDLGTIRMTSPGSATSSYHCLVDTAPGSTPWTATLGFRPKLWNSEVTIPGDDGFSQGALILRNSAASRIIAFNVHSREGALRSQVSYFDNPTTFNSGLGIFQVSYQYPDILWIRATDNGTNLLFDVSTDGRNWLQLFSAGRTAWLTSGANQAGFGCSAEGVDQISEVHEIVVGHFSMG